MRELGEIENVLEDFTTIRLPSLPLGHVYFEDINNPASLKKIQKLHEHESFYEKLMRDRPLALAQELLG